MAEPFPKGDFVRILFDRGLQLLREQDGWLVPSSERLQKVERPEDFERGITVSRLICDTDFNVPFFQPRRMFDPQGKPLSRVRYLKGYVEDGQRRIYKYMVEHHLHCAVAHLGYLAEAYGGLAVLHNTNRWSLPEHVINRSRIQLFDSALRHGESVFTALCTAMDASRFLIWRENPKPPRDLPMTLDAIMTSHDRELRRLVAPLETVWYEEGVMLERYRDCLAAHHPITDLGGQAGGFLTDADAWEMCIELPDDPTAHRAHMTFDNNIDMLRYAWTSTCRVVRCVEETLPQVHQLAIATQEPGRWAWLTDY